MGAARQAKIKETSWYGTLLGEEGELIQYKMR
jgi:hypothetical protein